jgi:putative heme-binding domain-containing protein
MIGLAGAVTQRRQSLAELFDSAARERDDPSAGAGRLEVFDRAYSAMISAAAKTARDNKQPDEVRIEAVQRLSYVGAAGEARTLIQELAADEPSRAVREAALEAAARNASRESWQELLGRFSQEPPTIRRALLSGALSRADGADILLDAIEASRIKPAEIDRLTADRLRNHGDSEVRRRAGSVFAAAVPADRQLVLDEYRPALKLEADALRGREVFARNCASCHRIGDLGTDVAPDISDSRTKSPEQLLTDIVQPNRAIDGNYVGYTAVTTDGRVLEGIVVSESSTAVTLLAPEGKSITLPRDQIEQLRSSGLSLMPEGLEREIPPQSMADVIAFIKGWRYLDGLTPLSGDGGD